MQSSPGEEFEGLFFNSLLMHPGVIADMSMGVTSSTSGASITYSTQCVAVTGEGGLEVS